MCGEKAHTNYCGTDEQYCSPHDYSPVQRPKMAAFVIAHRVLCPVADIVDLDQSGFQIKGTGCIIIEIDSGLGD